MPAGGRAARADPSLPKDAAGKVDPQAGTRIWEAMPLAPAPVVPLHDWRGWPGQPDRTRRGDPGRTVMSVISMAVLRPASSSASDELRSTLERQRSAFLKSAPPGLAERRADLAKLGKAIRESAPRLAEAISADFGNRSRHETMLAEVFTTLAGIRHAAHHLPRWMKPKRVSVSLELMPAQARIL